MLVPLFTTISVLPAFASPTGFCPAITIGPPAEPRPGKPWPEKPMPEEPTDDSQLECPDELEEVPMTDESDWEVFIPDDLECDPLPEPGDFWPNQEAPWD